MISLSLSDSLFAFITYLLTCFQCEFTVFSGYRVQLAIKRSWVRVSPTALSTLKQLSHVPLSFGNSETAVMSDIPKLGRSVGLSGIALFTRHCVAELASSLVNFWAHDKILID